MGTLVAKLLLPTLSSLAFLPTVSIAAKRQFHMEAMVYLFTLFFVAVSLGAGRKSHTGPILETEERLSVHSVLVWVMSRSDLKMKRQAQVGSGD